MLPILAMTIVTIASPQGARAEDDATPKTPAALPARVAQIALDDRLVTLTVGFRDVVDAEISRKLQSGLPTVLTMRGYVFSEAGGDPIALTAKSCRIVYDLWDEVFHIQLTQPGGSRAPSPSTSRACSATAAKRRRSRSRRAR